MVKRHTTLNVEDDLIQKAKEKFLNISEIAEEALRKRLGEVEVLIDTTISNCEFCERGEMRKATRDNLDGLTWLYPDERWICPNCLKTKERTITVGGAVHQ